MINDMYKMFVELVSKSRNLTYEETDKVSRGRVWTGSQAKKVKLVDETGDLYDIFTKANELMDQEQGKYFPVKEFKEKLKLDLSGMLGGGYGLVNKFELISEICSMYNKERMLAILPFWFNSS